MKIIIIPVEQVDVYHFEINATVQKQTKTAASLMYRYVGEKTCLLVQVPPIKIRQDWFTQVAIICAQESRYKQTIFKKSSLGALLYYGSF